MNMPYAELNATSAGLYSMNSFSSWTPSIALIIGTSLIIGSVLLMLMTNKRVYAWVMWFKNTLGYFFYGLGSSLIAVGLQWSMVSAECSLVGRKVVRLIKGDIR